jgi:hypothetical protein
MSDRQRRKVLIGGAAALAIIGSLVWRALAARPEPPTEPGLYYYTGPMRNKNGTAYGTADGREVPPPPGARPLNVPRGKPAAPASGGAGQ